MMQNERGQHPLNDVEMGSEIEMRSDAEIDALLKDYFKHEVPAELQQDVNTPQLVSVASRVVGDPHNGGWLGISVVVASLVTVALLLERPTANLYDGTARTSELNSSTADVAAAKSAVSPAVAKPDVEISVPGDFNDVDQYDTANGPVEQRSKLRIKNVTIVDPDTGAEVELFPELEIEIIPIDDE